ncbi:MAG TPA: MgtC/SapB family protein [Sphingobium sp.]|nr:MgtC/SapB family protein [Sphingobium sp.]
MEEYLSRLAVALAIGVLVGLERGWHSREEQQDGKRAAGLRTFALSGLLGGVFGALVPLTGPLLLGFGFLGFAGLFGIFHWIEAKATQDVGGTTVIAGLLTFILGAYAVLGDLQIAAAVTVAMTVILALREPLHKWVAALRWEEIRAVLVLLAMTFLLLPLLPDRAIDPWGSINPAEIWLLAIMIAAISFGGYVAVRLFGDRLGIVMAAVTGGLASSTAVTLTLAKLSKEQKESDRLLAGAILIAGVVMVARVCVVASLLNRALLLPLLWPLAAMGLVMAATAGLLLFRRTDGTHPGIAITNPLELGTTIKLAATIAVVMFAAEIVQDMAGKTGLLAVAALSGIADVDAITISMARQGHRAIDTAVQAIAVAVGVNTLVKAAMAGWLGGVRLGAYVAMGSVAGLVAAGATLLAR